MSCTRDRLALRIHDGAFSAMDLTARHPRTDELLSTVKFMVQTLAAADELQRDLQRELTYDGLRAAQAKGNKGGRLARHDRPGRDRTARPGLHLRITAVPAIHRRLLDLCQPLDGPPDITSRWHG